MKTLADVAFERQERPHGFVLVVMGALPADREKAAALAEALVSRIERELTEAESEFGIEVLELKLRMEEYEVYMEKGLPNAGNDG